MTWKFREQWIHKEGKKKKTLLLESKLLPHKSPTFSIYRLSGLGLSEALFHKECCEYLSIDEQFSSGRVCMIMQVLSRWRIFVILGAPIAQSIRTAATPNPSTIYWASFHSTDACFEKWKPKFKADVRSKQQPSKNCIRYAVRQKRADTKKALKNLLFNEGCSITKPEKYFSKIEADYGGQLNKKARIKPARQAQRAYHKKAKRKHRRENSCEDFDEYSERIFEATNGKRCFEWTFKPWEMGFDWRETSNWSKSTYQQHGAKSRIESDDESYIVGSYADRRILGLPTAGPLKIEDVKSAFRQSALKWHPDKHQGPSQADAEEKFKNCANAYKSLCNELASA